jgi:nicotinamidase/pyrazinamidase
MRTQFEREHTALIVVDLQPDFCPGGALPVAQGDVIIPHVQRLIDSDMFAFSVATQDWHPPGHISFASTHPGHNPFDVIQLYSHEQVLWPDHCVQGTPGAELHPGVRWDGVAAVIRKAMEPEIDTYSGFRNNWNAAGERPPTGLASYLRERSITEVVICGLARDYCVKWSGEDAIAAGFRTTVLWDLTRPVDPQSDERVRADLEKAGVRIIESSELGAVAAA